MILYHGTNTKINKIDLSKSKVGKDFGCGFYLNADKSQAQDMANRTSFRMNGVPIVNAFCFNEALLNGSDIKVKVFEDYCTEWVDFIIANRKNKERTNIHDYDIVIGPIADDTVGVQISRFISGYIDKEKLIDELKFRGNRAIQYFFATQKAVELLTKI